MENCVALNPNIISNKTGGNYNIGRVGINVGGGSGSVGANTKNNYARSDMKLNNGTTGWAMSSEGGVSGYDITAVQWGNASWWQLPADNRSGSSGSGGLTILDTYGPAFSADVWDFTGINGTNLPKLKNMPGGTAAQNPVVQPVP